MSQSSFAVTEHLRNIFSILIIQLLTYVFKFNILYTVKLNGLL